MKNVFMKINYCETITETETVRFENRYFKLVFNRKHILRSKPIHGCLHPKFYIPMCNIYRLYCSSRIKKKIYIFEKVI